MGHPTHPLAAPTQRLRVELGEVTVDPTCHQLLAYDGDRALHLALVLGGGDRRRVHDEAVMVFKLLIAAVELGVIAVGADHA